MKVLHDLDKDFCWVPGQRILFLQKGPSRLIFNPQNVMTTTVIFFFVELEVLGSIDDRLSVSEGSNAEIRFELVHGQFLDQLGGKERMLLEQKDVFR